MDLWKKFTMSADIFGILRHSRLFGVLLQGMDIRPPYHMMDVNGGHL